MPSDEKFPIEIRVILIVMLQFNARVASEVLPPDSKKRIVEELKQTRDMVRDPEEVQKAQEVFGFSFGGADETTPDSVQRGRAAFKGFYDALIETLEQ